MEHRILSVGGSYRWLALSGAISIYVDIIYLICTSLVAWKSTNNKPVGGVKENAGGTQNWWFSDSTMCTDIRGVVAAPMDGLTKKNWDYFQAMIWPCLAEDEMILMRGYHSVLLDPLLDSYVREILNRRISHWFAKERMKLRKFNALSQC